MMSDTLGIRPPPDSHAAGIDREAQAWLLRLGSGDATEEDAAAFRQWCSASRAHASAFSQARQVMHAVAPAARLAARPAAQTARHALTPSRRYFVGGALAAAVTAMAVRPPLGLWPSAAEFAADYRTGTGEQREVSPVQGVVVQMNTQTRINVASASEDATRLKLLSGEAEFHAGDATAPANLELAVANGRVTARRARFNVRHTGAEVCVSCLAGEILVSAGGRRATLGAGGQVTYGASSFGAVQRADEGQVSAWRRSLLVFNQVPLSTVVDEVNRYRPGKIILTSKELGNTQVQASLSIQRLDDVITLIRSVYGAEVTQLPGGVVLVGRA